MRTTRRFLIASSLARLIRKDRGGGRVTEGYFPNQSGRSSHVHLEGDRSSLVLVTTPANGAPLEERTDVPRAHAEALLDVATGKIEYARSRLVAGGREVRVDRFVRPGSLDLITIEFDDEDQAGSFRPPVWFGPEVTNDAAYQNRAIALDKLPQIPDVPLSNAALDTLLDVLENRLGMRPPMQGRPLGGPTPASEAGEALRRFSANFGAPIASVRDTDTAPAALAAPAPAEPPVQLAGGPAPAGESGTDAGGNLEIEDDVIRELARSQRPSRK
jgi:CYTH domain-containing protein